MIKAWCKKCRKMVRVDYEKGDFDAIGKGGRARRYNDGDEIRCAECGGEIEFEEARAWKLEVLEERRLEGERVSQWTSI